MGYVETNEQYPTAAQENAAHRQEYAENAIAPVELAQSVLFDALQYIRGCPGHDDAVARLDKAADILEDVALDLRGES